MKRTRRAVRDEPDDLRAEYQFDYGKARPNPYAQRLKGRTVAVVLEPDVAAVFPSSNAVNRKLRAAVAAEGRRPRGRGSSGRSNNEIQQTNGRR
jgi:hypothetical protein